MLTAIGWAILACVAVFALLVAIFVVIFGVAAVAFAVLLVLPLFKRREDEQ